MANDNHGFSTRAIHQGYDPLAHEGALTPPIHFTSTYAFDTVETGGACFAGEQAGHVYSRISNPTLSILEERMASLEGAEAALAVGSGIGAITSTLWTLLKAGDEIIVDKTLYGCTFSFLHHGLAKFGVTITHVDLTDPDTLAQHFDPNVKVVYFETPANPNMRLVDIAAVSALAKAHGALTLVDNTYATPYLTQPIKLGADIVVHSATKYLGGHGDLVAGMGVGSAELIEQIRLVGLKDMTGAVMSPFTAMLIMRGLKTLELRMERHSKSALRVAQELENSPFISKVSYPGLKSFPQYDLAKKQMKGSGGMIAFELKGGRDFINNLALIQCAVSLGDAETLIQHPASMTHSTYSPEERAKHGISDGLIRLSVGLESVEDVLADLRKGLDVLTQPRAA